MHFRASRPISGFDREFEEATGSPDGYRAIEAAAKGMAMTAVDILSDSSKMEAVRKAFSEMKAQYE